MSKLAVIFPGIGYSFDRPLLHFGMEWAAENGYEVMKVPYSGFPPKIRGSKERMRESLELAEQQTEILLKDVNWEKYGRILFISKSIGTIVAADCAAGRPAFRNQGADIDKVKSGPEDALTEGSSLTGVGSCSDVHNHEVSDAFGRIPLQILFTPFPETFDRLPAGADASNTIAFHGTGDPWMDNDEVIAAAKKRCIPMYLYDGANHSLETGETGRDLETLREVFVEIKAWKKLHA